MTTLRSDVFGQRLAGRDLALLLQFRLVTLTRMPAPLRICFVASEVAPLAKTGGLADVSGALPRYLQRKDHDVRLFLPFYSRIDSRDARHAPLDSS